MIDREVKLIIRYVGGEAESNKLDLYNASTSMLGLAKALNITTQALITKGKDIRSKGAKIPDVKLFLHPPKKGSFIETVSVIFEQPAVQAIGGSILTGVFWDMLEYTWKIATGKDTSPKTPTVKKMEKENELLSDEISTVLEYPFREVHRAINSSDMEIEIRRPRTGKIVTLNQATKSYVFSTSSGGTRDDILGNVTKYNIITGYGRFYSDEHERTIPFNIDKNEISVVQEELLKWSLYRASDNGDGKIYLEAEIINDKNDNVKRYIVKGASESNDKNNSQVV